MLAIYFINYVSWTILAGSYKVHILNNDILLLGLVNAYEVLYYKKLLEHFLKMALIYFPWRKMVMFWLQDLGDICN